MIQVYPNLYIGNDTHCNWSPHNHWAVIHACKYPCHSKAVGYKGNLKPNHPYYLVYKRDNHLVLNMVDMEQELLARFTNPIMHAAMEFIENNISTKKILIHCNQGLSRSPSIALLYLARRSHIASETYFLATSEFRTMYPLYNPGAGITAYLNRNWDALLKL
jgi:hypothetical protein